MLIEYRTAETGDYEEIIDLISYVFSFAYTPTDFLTLLPNLYTRAQFNPSYHYIVKEDGRIRAVVGSYPMTYHVCGQRLQVAGIGAVAVHPNSRAKGYMKALMQMALEDMKRNGVHLGCLNGQRQRYEYFGFTPCGVRLSYVCNKINMRHCYGYSSGKDYTPTVTLKEIDTTTTATTAATATAAATIAATAATTAAATIAATAATATAASDTLTATGELEAVWKAHHTKSARIERPLEQLPLTLSVWSDRCIGVWKDGVFAGYFIASKDKRNLFEVTLNDYTLLPDIIAAYLHCHDLHEVRVATYPHEAALVKVLSAFAESVEMSTAYNFNVLDFPAVLTAFLRLKSSVTNLPDGHITLRITEYGDITITVSRGEPVVTTGSEPPALTLSRLEAMALFFSPVAVPPANLFLRALLPIPLFLDESDKI